MTFVPTASCVRVDMQFTNTGQQVHNVIYCTGATNFTQVERLALANAIVTWWTTTGKTAFSNGLGLTQVTVVNQEADNAPSSTVIVSPVVYGTLATGNVPNNAAACATLRTDLRGRSYRGRMFLGGIDLSGLLDRVNLTTGQVTAFLTQLGTLLGAIAGVSAQWVVLSKFHNGVARSAGVATPITAISMDQSVDSQRRRLFGRGV
jgi:hypothetical protein